MRIDLQSIFLEAKAYFKIDSPVNIELYSDFPYLNTLVKTINITANINLDSNFECEYIDYTNKIIFILDLEHHIDANQTGKANITVVGFPTTGKGEIKFIGNRLIKIIGQ